MSRGLHPETPRHARFMPHDAKLSQDWFEAASLRADRNASEMLMIVEDEIADRCAFENAFRTQYQRLRWDD